MSDPVSPFVAVAFLGARVGLFATGEDHEGQEKERGSHRHDMPP